METAGAQLQPRYMRELAATPVVVLQALRKSFSAHHGDVRMEFRGAHAQVSIAPQDARWWSPWLTIEVVERDANHARIEGRFGSNPAFFTLWMMSLASALVISFSVGVFATIQAIVGESATIATCVFAFATLTSFVLAGLPLLGQHYARNQLQRINDRLEECYTSIAVSAETPPE